MARNPEGFAYDVSVVVFYKRVLPSQVANAASNERAVSAKVISTGLNGGELLLEQQFLANGKPVDGITTSPFDNLRTGQWIMLCGPHPNSSTSDSARNPICPELVSSNVNRSKEETAELPRHYQSGPAARPRAALVTVRGAEWPWQPRASYNDQTADVAKLSDDLCVGICRGAVAVHTKTLRLESPLGGAFGSGMSIVTPPGVTDPRVAF